MGFAGEDAKVVVAGQTKKSTAPDLPGTIHDWADKIDAPGHPVQAPQCDATD